MIMDDMTIWRKLETTDDTADDTADTEQHATARATNNSERPSDRTHTDRNPHGVLHESLLHERLKAYVCVLYASPCAPLLLPWLGEVDGTSLAMSQAKISPVSAHVPMFRVPTVLRRVPSAVPPTAVGACAMLPACENGPQVHAPTQ